MINQFETLKKKFEEVEKLLEQSDVVQDQKNYIKLQKEYARLARINEKIGIYEKNEHDAKQNKLLLQTEKDPALIELAKEEEEELAQQKEKVTQELKELLIPKDPNDDKNVVLELRAGTGGDEAAIWAGDLFRMYQRFSEQKNWKIEILNTTEGTSGGYKEIICAISGEDVYKTLKYESGIHRVQRIPNTETQGRIHTSAASVVVLPEMDEVDVELDMNEIRKDTFCSSGPGGQSVNTTYSAVRLTHLPTGIVVSCQDGKSQLKNFEKALKVLRSRLYERALKEHQDTVGKERKSMVGSGDRSDKIRTYNYPQGRVTDHRIHYTQHNLPQVLNGELNKFVEALHTASNSEELAKNKV